MPPTRPPCALRLLGAGLVLALVAGCSGSVEPAPAPEASASTQATGPTGTVAVLLRDGDVDRERGFDRGLFADAIEEPCPGCTVDYLDAEGDAAVQTSQLAALVDAAVDAVVLDPVEPLTVVTFVQQLRDYGTKVITLGPAIEDADVRVAFDDEAVGTAQARWLLRAAGRDEPQLLVVNGSPADPGAIAVKEAAHAVLDGGRATIVGEYDDLGPGPRQLRGWLATLLTFYPPASLAGVYAADDRLAGELLSALRAAGAAPDALPPITGADADLAGVRRLVAGTQLMTVYRPLRPGSERAADLVAALLGGTDPGETTDVDGARTALLDPQPIRARDLADTVVADRYWSVRQICIEPLRAACRKVGLVRGR